VVKGKISSIRRESNPRTSMIVAQMMKKFRPFYGNRSFITVYTRNRHWTLPWATYILFTPSHVISL